MEGRVEFVLEAIRDIQATIRAIDVKVAALLVGLLAPLGSTNRIFAHLTHFGLQSPRCLFLLFVILFVLMWLFALISLVRAIGAIDNPREHILNADSFKGAFYGGGLFPNLGWVDVFLNRGVVKATKDPQSFLLLVPKTKEQIERELVFEQLKLIYIRDVKLLRLRWGFRFSSLWLTLGIGIFLSSRYLLR